MNLGLPPPSSALISALFVLLVLYSQLRDWFMGES